MLNVLSEFVKGTYVYYGSFSLSMYVTKEKQICCKEGEQGKYDKSSG